MPDGKLTPQQFYDKYYPLAVKYTKGTPISPETFMSQFATESSWGTTANPQNGFAIFGIKAGDRDQAIEHDTTEENKEGVQYKAKAKFKAYDSIDSAMQDYVKLMQTPRYAGAFKSTDPIDQLKGIQQAGYGSKTYANLPSDIVRQNKKHIPDMADDNLDDIDTKTELNAQMAKYKKKAEAGKLSPQEFKDAKVLFDKAKVILENKHDFNVFASTITKDVFNPYIKSDAHSYRKDAGAEIVNLKAELLKAKTKPEVDEINQKLGLARQNYNAADQFMKKFDETSQKFVDDEKHIYDTEAAAGNRYSGTGRSATLPEADLQERIKNARTESVDKYHQLYNQFSTDTFKGYNDFVLGQDTQRSREFFQVPEITFDTTNTGGGGGGSGSISQTTTLPFRTPSGFTEQDYKTFTPNIHDMSGNEMGATGDPFALETQDPNELRKQIDLNKSTLSDLQKPNLEGVYEPDTKSGVDLGGYLMDIGRAGLGLKGATEKLPEYQTSDMYNQWMQDTQQRKDMGLSAEEIGFAKSNAERVFGSDVKNIRNLSGGSAGVALGNLSRANQQYYSQLAGLGATDQMVRRQNRQDFYNAAGTNEQVNQYKFGIDYENAMRNKQAGSALVGDALSNIMNRKQYEDSHGKGSQYYEYMKELTLGQRDANQTMEEGMQHRKNESMADLKSRIDADEKKYSELTNSYTNLEDAKKTVPKQNLQGSAILQNLDSFNPEELAKAGVQKTGEGEFQRNMLNSDPGAIKANERTGAKVYNDVMNTPDFQKQVESIHADYDTQIADLKSKMNDSKSYTGTKSFEKQIRDLEKKKAADIDAATLKQQEWADTQFDKDGNYIGK